MADQYPLRQESSTLSSDGKSWLRVLVWLPDPVYSRRGAVQLVHGMAEHIERYDSFARFLAGLGYVVFGHDHIGHGKSVSDADELGHMPLRGGKEILLDDMLRARKTALELAREKDGLPLFLFGHSMGSFVARASIARNPEGLAGAVLSGTGNQPRALSLAGRTMAHILGMLRGAEYRSKMLDSMAIGAYSKAIKDARTENDWISTDPAVVDAYNADPLSGQMFSVGGYATLTDLTQEVVTKKSAAAVPGSLPLLFIAGEEDPVGSCGKDVEVAAELYRSQGVEDVRVVVYPHMRHEVLNEPNRSQVYSDVEQWFTECMVLREVAKTKAQVEELYGVDSAVANEVSAEGEGEAQPSEAAFVAAAQTQAQGEEPSAQPAPVTAAETQAMPVVKPEGKDEPQSSASASAAETQVMPAVKPEAKGEPQSSGSSVAADAETQVMPAVEASQSAVVGSDAADTAVTQPIKVEKE